MWSPIWALYSWMKCVSILTAWLGKVRGQSPQCCPWGGSCSGIPLVRYLRSIRDEHCLSWHPIHTEHQGLGWPFFSPAVESQLPLAFLALTLPQLTWNGEPLWEPVWSLVPTASWALCTHSLTYLCLYSLLFVSVHRWASICSCSPKARSTACWLHPILFFHALTCISHLH